MRTQKYHFAIGLFVLCLVALAALAISPSATAQAQTTWNLVWGDEFDGSGQPSSTNWNYHVGNGFNPGANTFDGWGNGEWEWYRPENCTRSGGNLVIRGEYRDTATNISGRDWFQFSCRITSDTKRSIHYGAVEARIQMPNVYGTWPAFWMMGDSCDDTSTANYGAAITYYDRMATNWASCGEIDIMEHRNSDTTVVHNLFWDTRTGVFPWDGPSVANNPSSPSVGNVANFHTYRLEWTSTQLRWLIDGAVTKTQDISPSNMEEFRQPHHIIMNLAISGSFTGNAQPNKADFPTTVNIDYVRVYSAGTGPNPTATPTPTQPPNPTLPSPWQTQNIGSVGVAGGASAANGVFTVTGGGADIWGTSDAFRYVYQPLSGNGTITARVTGLQNTDGWAKAGVMIRESTAANSAHAIMAMTPSNGLAFQYRAANGGTSSHVSGGSATLPRWVRITRSGSTFTAYSSTNGTSWTTVGSANVTMGSNVLVGLAVTAHNNAAASQATFDNVSVQGGSSSCTGDFSQTVASTGSTTAQVQFTPCGYTAGYVILHYVQPGSGQQNVNMSYNSGAGRWEYNISGLSAGQTLQYQFTYQKNGLQYDSAWFSWVKP